MSFYKSKRINIGKLVGKLPDLKSQIHFLQETKILPETQTCTPCNQVLTKLSITGNYVFFRCNKCSKRISIRQGTVLSNCNLSLRRFILLVYAFTQHNWTYKQVDIEVCLTSDEEDETPSEALSHSSISKYTKLFREIIADHMEEAEKVTNLQTLNLSLKIIFLEY